MSKTIRKYKPKQGAITNEEKLVERENAIKKIEELNNRQSVRMVKISSTQNTWVMQK